MLLILRLERLDLHLVFQADMLFLSYHFNLPEYCQVSPNSALDAYN